MSADVVLTNGSVSCRVHFPGQMQGIRGGKIRIRWCDSKNDGVVTLHHPNLTCQHLNTS